MARKSIKTKQKTLGPRKKGAAMWNIEPGSVKKIPAGLTLGEMKSQYTGKGGDLPTMKRSRKANAEPSGGGGGKWKEMNEKMAASRAALQGQEVAEGAAQSGTSIFDPVLCELVYRWFCPPGGMVLDPFAGGSVRGIVASKLGRSYVGIDLSARQVEANRTQAAMICKNGKAPKWLVGDSIEMHSFKETRTLDVDLVFSCPPYCDLEIYSEDPRDLSTMEHKHFLHAYFQIIEQACARLKEHRFACFVVGDARDAKGFYYGLPWRTVEGFKRAGLELYNSAILVTAAGSLPVRVAKQFTVSRKLGTTHQHVFVFLKGDARKATEAIGEVEFGEVEGLAPVPSAVGIGGEV